MVDTLSINGRPRQDGEKDEQQQQQQQQDDEKMVSQKKTRFSDEVVTVNGEVGVEDPEGLLEQKVSSSDSSPESVHRGEERKDIRKVPDDPKKAEDLLDPKIEERVVASSRDGRFLRYELEIGRGSFKTVYKGLDTETGVAVAWCELQENKYNKSEQVRFKEEVSILKTLQHPNILRLYDTWEMPHHVNKKKVLILITELMTSGTLKGYMRRLKSIKHKMIRSWGRQILKGLNFLHNRTPPIIHRDLKCDNVFINGTTGLVKIGDLGLATLKRPDVKTVIGTPEFMAPEMYEESYDESVDVYAFGMCLLEMCTQEYPYMECSNPAQIYKRVTSGVPPQAIDRVDPVMKDIIHLCTKASKDQRYTVKNLLDHLFFMEGEVKVEQVGGAQEGILSMRVEVPTRETKSKGHEAVEFPYNIHEDAPETVVEEMVKSGLIRQEDHRNVSRSIREHVESAKQKMLKSQTSGVIIEDKKMLTSSTPEPPIVESGGEPATQQQQQQPPAAPKLSRQLSSNSTPEPSVSDAAPQTTSSSYSSVLSSTSSITTSATTTSATTTTSSTTTTELHALPTDTPPGNGERRYSGGKQALESHQPSHPSPDHPPVDEAPLEATSESRLTPAVEDLESKSPKGGRSGSLLQTKPEAPPTQVTTDTTKGKQKTEENAGKNGAGGETSSGYESSHEESSPKLHLSETTIKQHSTSEGVGVDDHSASNGASKKASKAKDTTKRLRLKLHENLKDGVAQCSMTTVAGQMITFRFSTQYDKPKDIFQNMIKSRHLQSTDQEQFISLMTNLIEGIKEGNEHHTSSSSSVGVGEASKTKLQSTELSAPGTASDHEEPTAKPSPHHESKSITELAAKPTVVQTTTMEQDKDTIAAVPSALPLSGLDGAKSAPSKKKQDGGEQSEPASTHGLLNSQASLDSNITSSPVSTPLHSLGAVDDAFSAAISSSSTSSISDLPSGNGGNHKLPIQPPLTCPVPPQTQDISSSSSSSILSSSSTSTCATSVDLDATIQAPENFTSHAHASTEPLTIGSNCSNRFEVEDVEDLITVVPSSNTTIDGSTESLVAAGEATDTRSTASEDKGEDKEVEESTASQEKSSPETHSRTSLSPVTVAIDSSAAKIPPSSPALSEVVTQVDTPLLTSTNASSTAGSPPSLPTSSHSHPLSATPPLISSSPLLSVLEAIRQQQPPSLTNFPNRKLVEENVARFLYLMDHMLREPAMREMVDQLDGYYSTTAQTATTHDSSSSTPEVPLPPQTPLDDEETLLEDEMLAITQRYKERERQLQAEKDNEIQKLMKTRSTSRDHLSLASSRASKTAHHLQSQSRPQDVCSPTHAASQVPSLSSSSSHDPFTEGSKMSSMHAKPVAHSSPDSGHIETSPNVSSRKKS